MFSIVAFVVIASSATAFATDPPPPPMERISASDGVAWDMFGNAVSTDGTTIVVGAVDNSTVATRAGCAYVFEKNGVGDWTEVAKLTASDGAFLDNFASDVAVDGNVIVAGAWVCDAVGPESGAAYVFERSPLGTWQQVAKLVPADLSAGDLFGQFVAVRGDRIVVGTPADDDQGANSGSAYVFERSIQGAWMEMAKLLAPDGAANDSFGSDVALDGNNIVVGAMNDFATANRSGSAYVFEQQLNGSWQSTAKLIAADGADTDNFGIAVAIDGDRILAGAMRDDGPAGNEGSVYVFERAQSGAWNQVFKIIPNSVSKDAQFGTYLFLDGDHALIGAATDSTFASFSGSASLFRRSSAGTWEQLARFHDPDHLPSAGFGTVALADDVAVVGAQGQNGLMPKAGCAFTADLGAIFSIASFGDGCAGTGGVVPTLEVSGNPSPASTIAINLEKAVGGSTAFLFLGTLQANAPLGFGCVFNVAPLPAPVIGPLPLMPFLGTGAGVGYLAIATVIPPSTPIAMITIQGVIADSGAPLGFCATNGVKFTLQ